MQSLPSWLEAHGSNAAAGFVHDALAIVLRDGRLRVGKEIKPSLGQAAQLHAEAAKRRLALSLHTPALLRSLSG